MLGTRCIGPMIWEGPAELNELRRTQDIDDELVIRFVHRQSAKQLLILDELRAGPREALHDEIKALVVRLDACLLYTSPSPRDGLLSRMPSSA